MYKVSMSYPATINFLEYLQKIQMLQLDHDGKKYKTTEKGLSYLKKHTELQQLLKP
jgi:predicted transcriptional regulator